MMRANAPALSQAFAECGPELGFWPATNIFNHTNFRLPDSDISSPTFNQIQAAVSTSFSLRQHPAVGTVRADQ